MTPTRIDDRCTIDVLLTPEDLADALRRDAREGLTSTPKQLPPKWFYDERGSLLFDDITRLDEYYPTRRVRGSLTSGHDFCTYFKTLGSENISFLTIRIFDQSDKRCPVWVVFNRIDDTGYIFFISFPIDNAITALMASASLANGHFAICITTSTFLDGFKKGFLWFIRRHLSKAVANSESGTGTDGFIFFYGHDVLRYADK
jgi:hypothetical protein